MIGAIARYSGGKAALLGLIQVALWVKIQAVAPAVPRQELYHQKKQRGQYNRICRNNIGASL